MQIQARNIWCKLNRRFYRLKQASKQWYKKLKLAVEKCKSFKSGGKRFILANKDSPSVWWIFFSSAEVWPWSWKESEIPISSIVSILMIVTISTVTLTVTMGRWDDLLHTATTWLDMSGWMYKIVPNKEIWTIVFFGLQFKIVPDKDIPNGQSCLSLWRASAALEYFSNCVSVVFSHAQTFPNCYLFKI